MDVARRELAELFTPMALGPLSLKNRFVMAPMTRSFSPDGIPGPDVADYYARRAQAGVGLIITEGVGIPHGGAIGSSGSDDNDIPHLHGRDALDGWRTVVERVHAAGGLIAPQLWHQGVMREGYTGPDRTAPSSRPSGLWGPVDRMHALPAAYLARVQAPEPAMTDSEVADVIAAYATAARNAADVGFDAIAIHGAHGYLIDTFLWAETNTRTDRWGGDLTRRSAFAAEVVRAIRREVVDRPIIFRFSQWKQQDFRARLAQTPQELETILTPLVEAGVDLFDASVRYFDRAEFEGSTRNLAGWTRAVTGKPTMMVGGVGLSGGMYDARREGGSGASDNLGRVADRLASKDCDLVGVGRALLSDPAWVERLRRGTPLPAYDDTARRRLW